MSKTYQTDGRRELLAFLRQNADRPLSIDEILTALPAEHAPARSSVYRLMTRLVEEGTVRRFVRGNSRQFTYQWLGSAACHTHLHLKCVDCGRLVHLDRETSAFVQERLLRANRFAVDDPATMLFGRCERCAAAKGGCVK